MPAPRPTTSTVRGRSGTSVVRWPEHALQAHVLRVRRSLRLAGVVIGQGAARLRGDRDRGRHAFADVDDVRVDAARRQEPAVGDERGRQRGHEDAAAEQRRGGRRRRAETARRAAPCVASRSDGCAGGGRRSASCCARWLPMIATSTNVVASAPTMAPRVRGVQPADGAARRLAGAMRPRARAEARAPQQCGGQHDVRRAQQVELQCGDCPSSAASR